MDMYASLYKEYTLVYPFSGREIQRDREREIMEMWVSFHCVLAFALPLVGWLLWWWNEKWFVTKVKERCSLLNLKLPPGWMGFPLFGELLTFLWYFKILRLPDDFIKFKKCKYGNNVGVYRTYLFGGPSIIVCSQSLCNLVLHQTDKFKQEWPTREALGSNSVITLDGPRHALIKSFIANAINRPDALARIVDQVQPSIVAVVQSWTFKDKIKIMHELKKVTLEYMGRHFAHFDLNLDEVDTIEKAFSATLQGFKAQPWNFPGTSYHHALKCRKKITNVLAEELEKRKRNVNPRHGDLMDGLMQLKDKQGNHLMDEEVLDNVFSSIHLSYMTISYMVTWSIYFLAKFPHVLPKLREENMEISKEKEGGHISYEELKKLTYTNKVVEEVIRLGNTTNFIFRKATDDFEFRGYMIPKGWQIILWLRNHNIDPITFEDPLSFNPDRWNEPPKRGTYFPFGGGTRVCPGNKLTRVNVAIFLHHLSIGYKWELINPNTKINYLSHPRPDENFEITFSKI